LYLQFFGLSEAPFSITPDPAFVYLSAAHREALAHLLYGVGQGGSGGFVQLTGEVGTGKTTLCRCLLEQVPEETQVALVLNPLQTPRELLATICEELGVSTEGISDSTKQMVDSLTRYLLEQHASGRRVVVVIDEAQNLSPEALEQVRLLTNLETAKEKLLQMVLLGQPELRQLLQRQNLRQLAQRITARYHLAPLTWPETEAYVRHRMQVAGARNNPFKRSALRVLYQRSGGVPRLINIIADRALAGAYALETPRVTAALVHAAANEVQPSETRVRSNRPWQAVAALSVVVLAVVAGLALWDAGYLGGEQRAPSDPTALAGPAKSGGADAPALPPGPTVAPEPGSVSGSANRVGATVGSYGPNNGSIADVRNGVPESAASSLDENWLERQHRSAWKAMAALWHDAGAYGAIRRACDGVAATGYACLRDHGSLSRIRQLGLPVLLVLHGRENRLLLFRGFAPDGLVIGTPEDGLVASRDAVERAWLGEYFVTWPQAPGWPAEIHKGESGAAVDIVMEMAGFADPAWTGDGEFDEGFESWLRQFQRRNGLEADGIIGPNTLIHLMAPTISEPRLVMVSEGRS
jgi:general secretion pathway protein A